jgi:predicted DNA-binding protein YlxM (UPF0122 family)
MEESMRKTAIIVGVVILAMTTAGIGWAATSAQEGDGPVETFLARVAEKLGIGEEQLSGAIQEVQSEMLDESVAEGRISEDKAERLRERIEQGPQSLMGFGHGMRFKDGLSRQFLPFRHFMATDGLADLLGMEQKEITAQLKEGKSLSEIAEGQGVSREALIDALVSQAAETMKEHGAALLDELPERIEQLIDNSGIRHWCKRFK